MVDAGARLTVDCLSTCTCSTDWLRTIRTSEPGRLVRTVARGSVCCVGFWFRGREFPTRGRVRPRGSRIPGQRPTEHRLSNRRLSSPEGWPGSPLRSYGLLREASRSQGLVHAKRRVRSSRWWRVRLGTPLACTSAASQRGCLRRLLGAPGLPQAYSGKGSKVAPKWAAGERGIGLASANFFVF